MRKEYYKDLFCLFKIQYLNKFEKYYKFFDNIKLVNKLDFEELLPEYFQEEYNLVYQKSLEKLNILDTDDYTERYKKYQTLFNKLTNSKINLLVYKTFLEIEKNETIKSCLKTFKPKSGYADVVNYSSLKTSTGRLVVKEGPNILTLPKRCRGILQTSFKEGKIISVDFNALEPRLFLKFNNEKCDGDIYEEISNRLEFQIDRSVIKRAIISILYGTNVNNLQNISDSRKEEIYSTVINYFGYNNLLEKASNINENDLRLNFFGRPINNLEEDKKHIIINNYVQSTAVDISLSYFTELTNILDAQKVKPLFIIHDAIVFDVASEYHNKFVEIIEQGYNDKDLGHFPVAIEDFN